MYATTGTAATELKHFQCDLSIFHISFPLLELGLKFGIEGDLFCYHCRSGLIVRIPKGWLGRFTFQIEEDLLDLGGTNTLSIHFVQVQRLGKLTFDFSQGLVGICWNRRRDGR